MAVTVLPVGHNSFTTSNGVEFVVRSDRTGRLVIHEGVCRHRGGPLRLGCLQDETVECPWHRTLTRLPRPASRRMPFVYARSGTTIYLVGDDLGNTRRVSVLEEEDKSA
ncbi:Rieske 2Fe-2S domain-containing protein [Luteipulveratus halotolerans]|uniref:Rieske 2Fe-2S domain-containing protein n=1 Tax=Luteipulveratus halotolerans TaxID=1631356 RepID=UPI0009E5F85E